MCDVEDALRAHLARLDDDQARRFVRVLADPTDCPQCGRSVHHPPMREDCEEAHR